ncbi:C2 family cysteine protease, partial [Limnofasciculus baicalensis]
IQPQVVAGESLAQAQVAEEWKNIDIPRAIAYNKGLDYSKETISVIQDTLKVSKTEAFNEETVLAIAKWQYDKRLTEVDGKIGYATRESLGITQRLFDDKEGYGYNYFEGTPFIKGLEDLNDISSNDVDQGDLGTCGFAAGMMAVARANPSLIRDLIDDNRDGTYNVKLYTESGVQIIKVTPYFPSAAPGIPAYAGVGDKTRELKELWPMLLEKAYAQYKEGYGKTGKGEGGYDLIGKGGHPGDAVEILTGTPASSYYIPDWEWKKLANLLINALVKNNWAVTAATIPSSDGEKKKKDTADGVVLNHSYVVEKIYVKSEVENNNYTEDQLFVDLQNPWGHSHITGLSLSKFRQYFHTLYINQVSQENVAQKGPVIESDLVEPSRNKPVAEMTKLEKIAAAISVAITKLGPELGEKLKDLLNLKTLAAMSFIMAAWALSHGTGAGQVLDVILIGVGVVTLGMDVISVIEDLIGFAAVLNAQTQEDIDKAGEHLAEAIATVGVELIIQFLTHRLAGSKAKKAEVDEAGVPRQRGFSVQDQLTNLVTTEGHHLIVTKAGKIFRCSSCEELGVQFAKLLEENEQLGKRLEALETKYKQISEIKDGAQQKVLLEEADGELTLLERNIQDLNVKRANRLLNQALDNFQPGEGITREEVAQILETILKSGEPEEKVALSKLVDELLSGGNSAAISDFLTRVTAIREVDGVVNGKFDQLYDAFHRGDAILAHGPLQTAIYPAKPHRLDGGQYSMVGSRDGKPAKEITTTWDGVVDFVIVYDGGNMSLILGKNHSGLSKGRAYVYGAGEFRIDKSGKVLRINNLSGHYLPTEENLWKSYNLLINKGLITPDVQVTPVDF